MQIGIALVASWAWLDPPPSGDAPRSDAGAWKVLDIDFWAIKTRDTVDGHWRVVHVQSVGAKKSWPSYHDTRFR